MTITHRNHYVPVWYQNRFLPGGQSALYYLNLCPGTKKLVDGRIVKMNELHTWSPRNCFWVPDLYTTTFFGIQNDEIERFLFGAIDTAGSKALRALVDCDLAQLYHLFIEFFEYMDAQKLRTPKGLDWIRSHYPVLPHIDLMLEMQRLRQMHCTMWVEAAREIVSAEEATVKFLISDHPVTVYNYACSPIHEQCKYPDDPSIALKASQTLFPLDLNHCLILTNLEYARHPKGVDPLSNRTHARFHGQTMVRFDTMIRTRRLTDAEVTAINLVMKTRARSCVAAAKKEWLYPEKSFAGSWCDIGDILLPPGNELWEFGGEIFAGGKTGEPVYYQDEFGRTMYRSEGLRKETKKNIGRNDPCPCGSGRKYKRCCLDKPASQRPSIDERSIRERNLILVRAITDILGLNKGKTWENVRRELSDEHVKKIYQVAGGLWSPETDLMSLLPHPDPTILRTLYTGMVDPRVILRNVIGFSLYVDEILVLSPFINPRCVKEEFSPVHSPQKYKQQTIKDVLLVLQLAPFIEAGIVNMIPDPGDFDFQLRKDIWDMAENRLKHWRPPAEEMKNFEALTKDDFMRTIFALPDESIKRQIRAAVPEISDERLSQTLEYMKEMRTLDPLALLQPLQSGKENAQYLVSHFGPNLELCLFIAQVTGSFVYTDSPHRWNEILAADDTERKPGGYNTAENLERILSRQFTFLNQVDSRTALEIRGSAKLGEFRKLLKQVWTRVLTHTEGEIYPAENQEFCDRLAKARFSVANDFESIRKRMQEGAKNPLESLQTTIETRLDWKIPSKGFGVNNVYRLLLMHSRRTNYLKSLPMAVFIRFVDE
jgi:hypothetical protein